VPYKILKVAVVLCLGVCAQNAQTPRKKSRLKRQLTSTSQQYLVITCDCRSLSTICPVCASCASPTASVTVDSTSTGTYSSLLSRC